MSWVLRLRSAGLSNELMDGLAVGKQNHQGWPGVDHFQDCLLILVVDLGFVPPAPENLVREDDSLGLDNGIHVLAGAL